MLVAGRKIIAAEGTRGLLTGFGPTAVGYFFQGGAKFAGYEAAVQSRRQIWQGEDLTTVQKKYLVELSGSREAAIQNRTAIYLGGAAIAESVQSSGARLDG